MSRLSRQRAAGTLDAKKAKPAPVGAPAPREAHGFSSSWVDRAWYDPEAMLLEIQFNDGVHVLYESVSAVEWREFKQAGSAGSYVRSVLERKHFRVK